MSAPQWHLVEPHIRQLSATFDALGDSPLLGAHCDQAGASVRDLLDHYGISLHDDEALYAGIVFSQLIIVQLEMMSRAGLFDRSAIATSVSGINGLLAVLLPSLEAAAAR